RWPRRRSPGRLGLVGRRRHQGRRGPRRHRRDRLPRRRAPPLRDRHPRHRAAPARPGFAAAGSARPQEAGHRPRQGDQGDFGLTWLAEGRPHGFALPSSFCTRFSRSSTLFKNRSSFSVRSSICSAFFWRVLASVSPNARTRTTRPNASTNSTTERFIVLAPLLTWPGTPTAPVPTSSPSTSAVGGIPFIAPPGHAWPLTAT